MNVPDPDYGFGPAKCIFIQQRALYSPRGIFRFRRRIEYNSERPPAEGNTMVWYGFNRNPQQECIEIVYMFRAPIHDSNRREINCVRLDQRTPHIFRIEEIQWN